MANPFNNTLSDEELVSLAREDSSGAAMLELLQRVSPFIISKSRQFGETEQDKQDFYQEGIVGFLSAVHAFRPNKGAGFTTFACTCALNRMKNLLKQRSKSEALELTSPVQDTQESPEQMLQAAFEAENIMHAISSKLSKYEKQVLFLYLQGATHKEIAEKTGKPVKSSDNALQRIRRKLKPAIDE